MQTLRWVIGAGVMTVAGSTAASAATPDPLGDGFTATPAQVLAAAKATPPGDAEVIVLREDSTISVDEAGRTTTRWRVVARIDKPAGVDDWGTLDESWSPFYQDKRWCARA